MIFTQFSFVRYKCISVKWTSTTDIITPVMNIEIITQMFIMIKNKDS